MISISSRPRCPPFAGVRVQASHQDPRCGDAEAYPKVVIENAQRLLQTFAGDGLTHGGQGQVGGGQRDTQPRRGQQHDGLTSGQVGDVLRMSTETGAGRIDDALMDRAGDQGAKLAALAGARGLGEGREDIAALAGLSCPGVVAAASATGHTRIQPDGCAAVCRVPMG